jgi:serine/threonine-protein kinase
MVRAEQETVGPESGSTERSPGDSSDTAEGEAPPNTQRIGKYEILKPLGRGGMGAVYKAFDPVLERDVALKVMLPETAGDPEQKQRFEREARAVARLSHPGIVTVFDLGYHTDGSPYIVMELLKGQDLLGRLREGPPLSIAQKVSIVIQVLDGLGHAHKAGIVHRDIKPANVFLSEGDVARIMDFGIAFCVTTGGTSKTVLGTVGYMSPEQVHGRRVDGRSDIFSVGTLLHEVLTGRRPFDAETPMATFYRIASGKAELSLPPGPEYEAFLPILGRALRVDVEERYPTAADFAEALRACTQAAPLPEAAAVTSPAPQPAARPTPPLAAPPQRADPSRLFALLREVYVGGKSGHLHLAVDGERKSLTIRQGQIVYGTSDTAGEHMGDILVRYGLISEADRQRALAVVLRERRRLGAVLIELGLLDASRVQESIGLHAREILFGAIARPGVTCTFEELADSLLDTDLGCQFSTGQLILEATRRILDPELVRTVLGDLGRVLVLSPNPMLRTQKITLTPADGFVLSRVDGSSSAREVMAVVPFLEEDAERSLFSLLCTGVIGYATQGTSARFRTQSPAASAAPAQAPVKPMTAAPAAGPKPRGAQVPAHAPIAQPPPAEPPARAAFAVEEIRSLILDTHERLKRDHFDVLGLERTATEAEIRGAYARFARVLHPDASLDASLEDLREKREAVFIRVTAAFEGLRDPAERAAYERAFEPSKFRVPQARVAPPQARVTAPQARVTAPQARVTAPQPRLAPPIVAVPAPEPRKPAPVQAEPPRPPIATNEPATPSIDPRLRPEHVLEVARRMFEDGQYWEAIQQLEPMVVNARGETRIEGQLLLARAYLRNPLWKKRAEGVLQAMLDKDPQNIGACLLLADIYREAQLPARAKALYRKVLETQPGHAAAREALAFLDRPPGKAKGLGGVASFFKKR